MSGLILIGLSIIYLIFLFLIAQWSENRNVLTWKRTGPYIYSLSIAVYCSAWTFYGSIGRAATSGIDFLAIYLGPVLVLPLYWILIRKIRRIVKVQHITSIADFIAARYGKSQYIGTIVAFFVLIAVTPYIALQIKAIGDSFTVVTGASSYAWIDPVLVTSAGICIFTLIYGTRYLSGNKPKTGMVSAIALESIVKLLIFLLGGFILIVFTFNGPTAIFTEAIQNPELEGLFTLNNGDENASWFWLILLSGFAFILLPRQFQVGVVENQDEAHLKKAMWLVPLYLLLINIFVLPIAIAGRLYLPESSSPDYYFLNLASAFNGEWLTYLIYFGGFSAATSMIIVSSLSLSNMLSMNVIFPTFIRPDKKRDYSKTIIYTKRFSLVLIFLLAYAYYHFLAINTPLVSIGLTSFVGVAQLAPAFFLGIYWKGASRKGALYGMLTGFAIWFYALILPSLLIILGFSPSFLADGFFAVQSLSPIYFGAITGMSPFTSVIAFSLMLNLLVFITLSLFSKHEKIDANQAEIFVNIMRISKRNYDQAGIWQANVLFLDIKSLLISFLGDVRTEKVLDRYARINGVNFEENQNADSRVISYAERLLTSAIGPASARIMIASVVKGEELSIYEVMDILNESKEVLQLNRELYVKHDQLEEATNKLKNANERLIEYSDIKDEFLYTVTHELRTPLTAIRAQAEILEDDDEIPESDRKMFLSSIVRECERLTNLITNVLDLEKFESGSQQLDLEAHSIQALLKEALASLQQLINKKKIEVDCQINIRLPDVMIDRDRVFQVMVNLISNAIKYCDHENGKVMITAYVLDRDIKVNIIDNGSGMNKEEANFIFDKFYQIKNQTRKKPLGSGLGLAICKNIIQMHGGKIWVQPESTVGTRFSFTIPIVYVPVEMDNN